MSVENGMTHSRSVLLLHRSTEQSGANKAKQSRAEPTEPAELSSVEQGNVGTPGINNTFGHMDQRMEFSLVEREF